MNQASTLGSTPVALPLIWLGVPRPPREGAAGVWASAGSSGGLGIPGGRAWQKLRLEVSRSWVRAGRPSPWPPAQPPRHLVCNSGPRTLIWQGPGWVRINPHSTGSRAWNIQNTWEMVQVFTVVAINMKKIEAERQSGTLGINLPKSQSTFFFGCAGSSLLHRLSLVAASGGYFWFRSTGFSLGWLLLSRCRARALSLTGSVVVVPVLESAGSIAVTHGLLAL